MRKQNAGFLFFLTLMALVSCNGKNPLADLFPPDIKICDLYQQPSVYADSLIDLKNVSVTKCSGFLKFYCAEITDGQCNITLLTNKPFRVGEKVRVKGRYEVVAQNNETTLSLFVDERMEGLKDVVRFFTGI